MKKVSTLTGIIVILATVAVLFGGIFVWQHFGMQNTNIKNDTAKVQNESAVTNDGFSYVMDDDYAHAKDVLKGNGWLPVIPTSYEYESGEIVNSKPIDKNFPEIGYCGSGRDKICNVDFRKGTYQNHLNLQFKDVNGKLEWIVVGNE